MDTLQFPAPGGQIAQPRKAVQGLGPCIRTSTLGERSVGVALHGMARQPPASEVDVGRRVASSVQ